MSDVDAAVTLEATPAPHASWSDRIEVAATTRFTPVVAAVALFGLALRLVLGRFEPLPPTNLLADETWYVRVAHNVLTGKGFVLPTYTYVQTALHGPLTVFLLLPATLLEPYGYTAQRATMSLIGAAAIVVIALAARELAGARVGLVAALLAAVYPGLWVNDLVATSESPAALLLASVLLLSLRYRREPTTRRVVLLGLALGLLALDRAELAVLGLLLAVPAFVAVARRSSAPVATFVRAILVVLVLLACLVVPWSAYNQSRFHQTVLISNDLGQTLVGANCSSAYYGPLTGYDAPCYLAVLRATPKGLNEAGADAFYRRQAISYAIHHWERWPVVGAMRELWLWSLWRPGWTVHMSAVYIGRPQWIAWSQIVAFWLLTPFALYGFYLARRRRIPVAPIVTMVAFTAAIGLLVVGHLRYRLPAELAWVLLGAIALDRLVLGAPREAAHSAPSVGDGGGG